MGKTGERQYNKGETVNLINESAQAYTSIEVSSEMVKETKQDRVTIRSHFKSRTQEEIDIQVAEILSRLINKELETIR